MNELVKLAKGLIGPTDVAVSGKLTPQAAERIISMVLGRLFVQGAERAHDQAQAPSLSHRRATPATGACAPRGRAER